jgi:aminotransferase
LAALEGPQDVVLKMKEEYDLRRKFCMKALDDIGFTYGDPGGAFYIYTNVSNSGLSASLFCKNLLEKTGVLLFPGTLFGDTEDKYIRLSYLQPIDKIEESMKRIKSFVKS